MVQTFKLKGKAVYWWGDFEVEEREESGSLAGVTTRPFAGFLDESAAELRRRASTWGVAFLVLATISLGSAGPREILLDVGMWIPIFVVSLGVGGYLFHLTWSLLCHSHPYLAPKDVKVASFRPGLVQLEMFDGTVECHIGDALKAMIRPDSTLEVLFADGRKLYIPPVAFKSEEDALAACACLTMRPFFNESGIVSAA
jgi:hypothetical protein